MPAGVTLSTILAVLIPVGIVTVLLRWLPFAGSSGFGVRSGVK